MGATKIFTAHERVKYLIEQLDDFSNGKNNKTCWSCPAINQDGKTPCRGSGTFNRIGTEHENVLYVAESLLAFLKADDSTSPVDIANLKQTLKVLKTNQEEIPKSETGPQLLRRILQVLVCNKHVEKLHDAIIDQEESLFVLTDLAEPSQKAHGALHQNELAIPASYTPRRPHSPCVESEETPDSAYSSRVLITPVRPGPRVIQSVANRSGTSHLRSFDDASIHSNSPSSIFSISNSIPSTPYTPPSTDRPMSSRPLLDHGSQGSPRPRRDLRSQDERTYKTEYSHISHDTLSYSKSTSIKDEDESDSEEYRKVPLFPSARLGVRNTEAVLVKEEEGKISQPFSESSTPDDEEFDEDSDEDSDDDDDQNSLCDDDINSSQNGKLQQPRSTPLVQSSNMLQLKPYSKNPTPSKILKVLLEDLTPTDKKMGMIYILRHQEWVPDKHTDRHLLLFKIGWSKYETVKERYSGKGCRNFYNASDIVYTSKSLFKYAHRVEQLAFAYLYMERRKAKCPCGTEHEEYFISTEEHVRDVVQSLETLARTGGVYVDDKATLEAQAYFAGVMNPRSLIQGIKRMGGNQGSPGPTATEQIVEEPEAANISPLNGKLAAQPTTNRQYSKSGEAVESYSISSRTKLDQGPPQTEQRTAPSNASKLSRNTVQAYVPKGMLKMLRKSKGLVSEEPSEDKSSVQSEAIKEPKLGLLRRKTDEMIKSMRKK